MNYSYIRKDIKIKKHVVNNVLYIININKSKKVRKI